MKKKLLLLFTLIGLHDLIVAGRGGGHGGGGRGGGRGSGGRGGGGRGGRSHGSGHGSHGGHNSRGHGGRGYNRYGRGGYGHGGYGRGYYGRGLGWGVGGFGLGIALTAPYWWSGPNYYGGNTYIENYKGWNMSDNGTLSNGQEQIRLGKKDLKRTLYRLEEDLEDMKNNNASDSDIAIQQSKIDELKDKINQVK